MKPVSLSALRRHFEAWGGAAPGGRRALPDDDGRAPGRSLAARRANTEHPVSMQSYRPLTRELWKPHFHMRPARFPVNPAK